MKLEKYTVKQHSFGIFTKEHQLNDDSRREYNIIKNKLDMQISDIIRRISNLYNLNSHDATKTLNDLMAELKEISDYKDRIFKWNIRELQKLITLM